jgi:hypothetical protein
MKFIRSLIHGCNKKWNPEDFGRMGALIRNLMDKATYEVFAQYRDVLLRKPVTYVVPAVWGVNGSPPLDSLQREMNEKIAPVVDEVMESLQLEGLDQAQEFALHYLVRGYMVLRLVYMIEAFRGRSIGGTAHVERGSHTLEHLEPVGTA